MEVSAATAKAYLNSTENVLLVPNRDFGRRKYINVSMNRQFSLAKNKNNSAPGSKQWVHPPETLIRGHIVYNVKFLGHVEVETPKGSDVVRDAIRKMKFNKQIKKAEGQKTRKVELTISVDGVTIQDAKTKVTQHQYPLHRISYCADDKSDKRMLTFIAKASEGDLHHCFVFESEKCAEEITLTIGQAFDLAYRRFLESHGRDMDMKKQFLLLQKKVQQLTEENLALKARIADLERSNEGKHNADVIMNNHNLSHQLLDKKNQQINNNNNQPCVGDIVSGSSVGIIGAPPSLPTAPLIPAPPPTHRQNQKTTEEPQVGRRLEGLLLEDSTTTTTPKTNGHTNHSKSAAPALAPPPVNPRSLQNSTNNASPQILPRSTDQAGRDLFGAEPFGQSEFQPVNPARDPFGMGAFKPGSQDLDTQIQIMDAELMDLQTGFSQGLSFGTTDYSLEDFDPLNKK